MGILYWKRYRGCWMLQLPQGRALVDLALKSRNKDEELLTTYYLKRITFIYTVYFLLMLYTCHSQNTI